jgi:protocatechuate 3,4-dioxygenase beta subunit
MNRIRIALLLLAVLSLSFSKTEKCGCLPASPNDTTSWGQQNVIIKNDGVVQSLRGIVVGGNRRPLGGVLVEVYDKPEGLLMDWKEREARKPNQRRVVACVTAADGEFCFSKIPPGKYELRCSKPVEWDSTSAYVIVAPKTWRSTSSKIVVPLQMSH